MSPSPDDAMRTWIVSSRLPWTAVTDERGGTRLVRSPGGLVSAMLPVYQGGDVQWVGHGGFPSGPDGMDERLASERLVDTAIPDALYDRYYNGAANGCLWPVFHYFPALAVFSAADWEAYREVNRRFADALLARVRPGDLVWVHDYQLMLLPGMLRGAIPELRIGYFHHVPFPGSEVFKLLPGRDEVLAGLLGADLVGFHTLEYARHFASACGRLLDHEIRGEQIHAGDRIVRTGAFPLGIDTGAIRAALASPTGQSALADLQRAFAGRRLILGVDRLDYSKGIRERLEAFAEFLRRHPDARRDTVLLLLCVPSRVVVPTYAQLRNEIEQLVSRINGEFGTPGNQPVHYLFQSRDLPELTALYRRADVCLVTPLRDGLNLVCKEYCAAHDDHDGVLIISEFAGASEELGEAIVVNPFDTIAVADAIHTALTMPRSERRRQMQALHTRVMNSDNRAWAGGFIADLLAVAEQNADQASRRIDEAEDLDELWHALTASGRLLVTIDTDAFATRSAGNSDLLDIVRSFSGAGLVVTFLFIGSGPEIDAIPGIAAWYGPENGAVLIDPAGGSALLGRPLGELGHQHAELKRIMTELMRKVPRSRIREGLSTITWVMGRMRSDMARVLLQDTRVTISMQVERLSWHCARVHGGVSVRSGTETLALAMGRVMEAMPGDGPVTQLSIGDRCSDEQLFTFRKADNHSIAIGTPTAASRYLVADGRALAVGLLGSRA